MQNDQRRPGDAEDHVQTKPVGDPSDTVEKLITLAERIKNERQHDDGAGNAKPIANTAFSGEIALVALEPSKYDDGDHSATKCDRAQSQQRTLQIMAKSIGRRAGARRSAWSSGERPAGIVWRARQCREI